MFGVINHTSMCVNSNLVTLEQDEKDLGNKHFSLNFFVVGQADNALNSKLNAFGHQLRILLKLHKITR